MQENSYGQTWLEGDVSGWHTIAVDNTNCDTTLIASRADAAASAAGYDLSAYGRFVYIFPTVSVCGWSGSGTVGGVPSQSWINGKFELKTIGHELGHNFGLQHSHALECGATTLGTNCQSLEYGDHFDIMGNYTAGHLNAFQKAQLGWLGYGSSPAIATASSSGTYVLETYESNGSGGKALKIARGADPATGEQRWLYLEFRQAMGADSFLAGNANVLNGVVFHSGIDTDVRSSFHVDMTPASQSYGWDDWEDAALPVGATFADPDSGAIVTTVSAGSGGASLSVTLGAQSCVRANPALSFSPAQGPWVAPGTAVSYSVSVTNLDNSACGASSFNLQAPAPSGWSAAFDSPSLNLQAGETATATLTVISPLGGADGFYAIGVVATNAAAPAQSATGSVSYAISVPAANQPPVATDDSTATAQNTSVAIAVLANDYDPDGDALALVSVSQAAHGKVSVNADGTVTYAPSRRFTGDDSFSYQLSDGQSTVSATVSVSVAADGGSAGGGSTGGGGKGGGKNK
jgi:hypothetical protein